MKWFYLAVGLILFFVFTQTGAWMRADFPDKALISPDLRILMRSRHIYILFNSLILIVLGIYFRWSEFKAQRVLQIVATGFLTLSSVYLVYGWWAESYELGHYSDISRWGIYLSLAGVIVHVLGGLKLPRREA